MIPKSEARIMYFFCHQGHMNYANGHYTMIDQQVYLHDACLLEYRTLYAGFRAQLGRLA